MAQKAKKAAKRKKKEAAYKATRGKRTCGDCRLCCYTFPIPALDKPRRTWCKHVTAKGCAIHDGPRPDECVAFTCLWLRSPTMPDRFRPDRIGCMFWEMFEKRAGVSQQFKGAADRAEARHVIADLVSQGWAVSVFWTDDNNHESVKRFYDPANPPPLPSLEGLRKCNMLNQQMHEWESRHEGNVGPVSARLADDVPVAASRPADGSPESTFTPNR